MSSGNSGEAETNYGEGRHRLVRQSHSAATAGKSSRVEWMDFARGVCVILVVLHHVIRQMADRAGEEWAVATEYWQFLDTYLTPIRIPLFFVVSGMLAANSMNDTLVRARRKFIVPAYLYVVWSTLLSFRELIPFGNEENAQGVESLLVSFFMAASGYWYIYALPIYYLIAHYVRSRQVPVFLVFVPLAILSILREPLTIFFADYSLRFTDSPSLWGSILANIVFYMIGVYFKDAIISWAKDVRLTSMAALLVGYSILVWFSSRWDLSALEFFASLVGIVLGVSVSVRLVRFPALGRTGCYIGARTLPVYVLQFFFVSMLSVVWTIGGARMSETPVLAAFYPALVTGCAVSISLALYSLLNRTFLKILFSPPRAWISPGGSRGAN